ncbi:CDP-alcohol phosphatidyltransferase family protein [Oleisolibacter albus]|uniref:CDP-alcohol phosphatidyltransferase family protein n=1 Tax=Oleisolibacter albus TaxID=2171757 RepID=UPI000DF3AB42|nr:CDP-alcohol phosphatidyltransferase family protein [Oleisolibacter albus]
MTPPSAPVRQSGHRSAAGSPARLRVEVGLHLAAAGLLLGGGGLTLSLERLLPPSVPAATLLTFALVAALACTGLDGHDSGRGWGHANRVTLLRGGLTCLLAGAVPLAPGLGPAVQWGLAVTAVIALALDGVDGWLARRHGQSSPYGARFDMELDTLLTLVLALLVWRLGEAGIWVLGLGLLRPLFVAAGWLWPWLTAPLPFSRRRRAVCVVQVAVPAAALTPLVAPPLSGLAAGAALALLLFSFAVDTVWLFRHGTAADRMIDG